MKKCILVLISVCSFSSAAVQLPAIPSGPGTRLPIDTSETSVDCEKIVDRLLAYNQMARQHDASISGFLGEVVQKVSGWYELLSPLEGTPQTIALGTFKPIEEGTAQISSVTDLAYENSDLLSIELDKIITSLRACNAR